MSIESDIYSLLTGDSSVTGLLSASTAVYHVIAPEDVAAPFVVYRRESTEFIGAMGADTAPVRSRWRFLVYADTSANMRALRDAVRALLQRWRKTAATAVQNATIEDMGDFFDPELGEWFGFLVVGIDYVE